MSMRSRWLIFGLFAGGWMAAGAGPAVAQITSIAEPEQAKPPEPEPVVWEITPAAEPDPALRHRFWPAADSLVPGNAMIPVQRSLLMMHQIPNRRELDQQYAEASERWTDVPLAEMPLDEVRKYLEAHQRVLAELHRGTAMEDSEYDLGLRQIRGPELVEFVLPEMQEARQLARLLQLEARVALAEGRYEDAIRSIQTGIRLADSIGSSEDLLVIKLIGLAIAGLSLGNVEAAATLPGSPNLYWALATIPDSVGGVRPAIVFEAQFLSRVFPTFSEIPDEPIGADAWRERLVAAVHDLQTLSNYGFELDPDSPTPRSRMLAGLALLALAEKSRAQLIEDGVPPDEVGAMTPSEAVVRATSRSMTRIQDDFAKWVYLPDSLRRDSRKRFEEAVPGLSGGITEDLAAVMAASLLPAIWSADQAGMRTEQTIARLATVQAMRDYAAHHGRLPESLEDLENLPAWPDPLAGEPFGYTRVSPTEARLLSAPAYPSDPNAEITIRLRIPEEE